MKTASQILEGFKRGPSIEMSTWYKGILTSQLATDQDTGGAFDFVMSYMRTGTEPPPHVHEREHEFFYVLEGDLEAFVADKCFRVCKGECVFFPAREPHAFKILSPEIRLLVLITPGGFLSAINGMATPAQTLDIPRDEVLTYANMNLRETMQVFERYGVRILSMDEVALKIPQYRSAMPRAQE